MQESDGECRLTFVLSRGVVVDRISPPSRISSEGGECCHIRCSGAAVGRCCHVERAVSHIPSEEGMAGWRGIHPPPSCISSAEGGTGLLLAAALILGVMSYTLRLAFRAPRECVAGSRIDIWCDEEGFTPPRHIENDV